MRKRTTIALGFSNHMKIDHVIAEAQGDGVVNMRRVGHRPNLPETVHHVTLPVNEDMVAVIWWPDRLPPKVE
jgi:hypothetical protein